MKAIAKHAVLKGRVACNSNKEQGFGWRTTTAADEVNCKRCIRVLSKGVQQELSLAHADKKPDVKEKWVWIDEEFSNR